MPVTTTIPTLDAVHTQPELTQQSQPTEQFEFTEQPKRVQQPKHAQQPKLTEFTRQPQSARIAIAAPDQPVTGTAFLVGFAAGFGAIDPRSAEFRSGNGRWRGERQGHLRAGPARAR